MNLDKVIKVAILESILASDSKVINLTPHSINFVDTQGNNIVTVEPEAKPARCEESRGSSDSITIDGNSIPVNKKSYGEVYDLPEKQTGTYYLVSMVVAEAVKDRDDLLFPDKVVRDDKGEIIGCESLARV